MKISSLCGLENFPVLQKSLTHSRGSLIKVRLGFDKYSLTESIAACIFALFSSIFILENFAFPRGTLRVNKKSQLEFKMASEPIKVYIRFRPLSSQECELGEDIMWNLNKNSVSILSEDLNLFISDKRLSSNYNPSFQFDHCFSWDAQNEEIYTKLAKNLVLSALDGYNATIFAYGQTGSGKTFTMLGKPSDSPVLSLKNSNIDLIPSTKSLKTSESNGIIILALEDIFSVAHKCTDRRFFFSCSYMEIYNEHVYDLLKSPEEFTTEVLGVIEGPGKEFVVRGLSEQVVTSIHEVLERLHKGEENRHYASTNLNHHSSRSHTIFKLNVKSLKIVPKANEEENFENITTESALNFVDLAGSEKVNSSQAAAEIEKIRHANFSVMSHKSDIDKIMAEGKNINTSLFYLCQVINKLSEKKLGIIKNDSHIPFRNSNLTKILRSSLAGNARTCIICTATAARSQFEQTLSTLRFGNSARSITNKVRANIRTETNTQLLLTYEQDIASLKKEVELTYQRGKAYTMETMSVRQQIENKITNLSKKILKKLEERVVRGSSEKKFRDLWGERTGELFVCNGKEEVGFTWENEKFTEKGNGIWRDLQVADREKKNLLSSLANVNNSINCLNLANKSLVCEKEKYEELIENDLKERNCCENKLEDVSEELNGLKKRIDLFENENVFEGMSSDEIEKFEKVLLERINDVKQERAERKYSGVFQDIMNKVESHLNG